MPNRLIKESIIASETLAQLNGDEERLFWRLVVLADDYGRFHGDPVLIRPLCFPRLVDRIPQETFNSWLLRLVEVGLVVPYESGGRRYLQIRTWMDHQGPPRAKRSKFPDPPDPLPAAESWRERPPSSANACEHLHADARSCEQTTDDAGACMQLQADASACPRYSNSILELDTRVSGTPPVSPPAGGGAETVPAGDVQAGHREVAAASADAGTSPSSKRITRRQPEYGEDHPAYQLALHLREAILQRDPNTKVPDANPTAMARWAREADLLLRVDERDPDEARYLIDWCQRDDFWAANILSMGKFREKYDQLKRKALAQTRMPRDRPHGPKPTSLADTPIGRIAREMGVL